ncbi:MAG: cyclase family protein [Flavobacteriales bacterium]|nr:cyclase family protein [Flavobacteriales bacterium]MDP4717244.1 cyclase family protein [Flavobacteriales bacterium]MDP4730944.1 cyclase family protein [Flavobacteriales bacterium]MDP4950648.1 cyclase family protein [Flavobacteriales bacterium]MDP5075746.1 cyclase family protein [Flavobacteriales bacterium]
MKLTLQKDGRTYSFQTEKGKDISISLNPNGPRAWYVEPMRIEPVRTEQFLGSVAEGGAVNFRDVYFNPHGHGTHTENVGHIIDTDVPVVNSISSSHYFAKLVTVELRRKDATQGVSQGASQDLPQDLSQNLETCASQDLPQDLSQNLETGASQDLPQDLSQNLETAASQGDWVVNEESLMGVDLNVEALIIRTKPNDHSKTKRQYSGTNFPYLTIGAMQRIVDAGVQHLLVDLPSVDREEDGGALAAHHLFWNVPAEPNFQKTITELIYVPNEISDGNYILNLQVSNFANDAAPSRPMLFDLEEE